MTGLAKSSEFLLSSATVMIGPMADLKKLNPAAHSIGLVKNMAVNIETSKTELTQGLSNDVVASVITGNTVTVAGEVYEYTAKTWPMAWVLMPPRGMSQSQPVFLSQPTLPLPL